MNITLPPKLAEYVERRVKDGSYATASEVVSDALRPWAFELGVSGMEGSDIEAVAFLVLMQATQSAREDLKMIMAEVKAMTAAKAKLRELMRKVARDAVNNACAREKAALDFSAGMGSERAYHTAPMPVPDAESKTGVRIVRTDLYPKRITCVEEIRSIAEDLKGKLDAMNEMSEMTSLRLQMVMDRRSKFMSTLSNIMKKMSTTQDALVQNLK